MFDNYTKNFEVVKHKIDFGDLFNINVRKISNGFIIDFYINQSMFTHKPKEMSVYIKEEYEIGLCLEAFHRFLFMESDSFKNIFDRIIQRENFKG